MYIYIRKISGPKMEPCGTPVTIGRFQILFVLLLRIAVYLINSFF